MNGKRMTFHTPEEELRSFERIGKRKVPKSHGQPCLTTNLTEDFDYLSLCTEETRQRFADLRAMMTGASPQRMKK